MPNQESDTRLLGVAKLGKEAGVWNGGNQVIESTLFCVAGYWTSSGESGHEKKTQGIGG